VEKSLRYEFHKPIFLKKPKKTLKSSLGLVSLLSLNIKDMTNIQEIWKDIPSLEGKYQASNLGRIKSKRGILKLCIPKCGYPVVGMPNNKITKVHRLVAISFIPNTETKPFVNHKNGIKTDNRIDNLEWCTHKENKKHASENGLVSRGINCHLSKITENQVIQIRKKHSETLSNKGFRKKIASEYQLSVSTITRIVNRKIWKHL